MKKDVENNEKDVLKEKGALSDVVQVNFTESADDLNGEAAKSFDKSSSKQELLKEIERLNGVIKSKDAEIDRLSGRFGELLDIENKKEESIEIHKRAVDALSDALKESEKIIGNAKKVAEKIVHNAGNSIEQKDDAFAANTFTPALHTFEEPRRSVAEETMQELMQIRSNPSDFGQEGFLGEPVIGAVNESDRVKLPGADDLVISKDILTANSIGVDGLAGINMEEIDEFLANINKDDKNKAEDENTANEDESFYGQHEEEKDENSQDEVKKEKKGWFRGFSRKK